VDIFIVMFGATYLISNLARGGRPLFLAYLRPWILGFIIFLLFPFFNPTFYRIYELNDYTIVLYSIF